MPRHFPITHYEAMWRTPECGNFREIIKLIISMMGKDPTDFLTFADKIMGIGATYGLMLNPESSNFDMAIRMTYHMWRVWATDERIYYVSPQLCEMLLHTKLTLDASFIQSPFEEVYLYTDQSGLTISDHTGTRPVRGVYINLRHESDGIRKLRFLATSGADGISKQLDVNHFACFLIPEHGRMEDIIDRQFQSYLENDAIFGGEDHPVALDKIADIFRFTVNLLLYITSAQADLESIKPKSYARMSERKQRKYRSKAQLPFIYVGRSVKRPQGIVNVGSGTKITHKFWVSGHWRAQWKGSSKDDSRRQERIWIEPYVKGPDLAEGLSKKYIVKED